MIANSAHSAAYGAETLRANHVTRLLVDRHVIKPLGTRPIHKTVAHDILKGG